MLDDNAYGLSRRRVTLSTSGLVPALDRLGEDCPVALAVSLHAPNDALRDRLVPINRKYPIRLLIDACLRYIEHAPRDPGDGGLEPRALADAFLAVLPMRCSARETIQQLAACGMPGPEVSVDKVLLARAELAVFDLARDVLDGAMELGDDREAREWRHDYLFSRSAPIYGGSYEIQRQILAERVLGLPRG